MSYDRCQRDRSSIANYMRWFGTLLSLGVCVNTAAADPVPAHAVEYPATSVLHPDGLAADKRDLLHQLYLLPVKDNARTEVREKLCPVHLVKPDPTTQVLRAALAVTESDSTVEIKFDKTDTGRPTEAPGFSVYLEFVEKGLLIRPSLPRFPSDGFGLLVPYPTGQTRFLWVEGKRGSDLLFLIPDARQCGVQSVAICPRTFAPPASLAATGYVPVATRYLISGKADGLFAVDPGETGRVQASMLANEGVVLPDPWKVEDKGATPSATLKYSSPRGPNDKPPPFIPGTLPVVTAIESRLDFGKETSMKTSRTRTTIEVSQFNLPEKQRTVIRGRSLEVEAGACYMVTKWQERYQ